jgi:hypothetical protein
MLELLTVGAVSSPPASTTRTEAPLLESSSAAVAPKAPASSALLAAWFSPTAMASQMAASKSAPVRAAALTSARKRRLLRAAVATRSNGLLPSAHRHWDQRIRPCERIWARPEADVFVTARSVDALPHKPGQT